MPRRKNESGKKHFGYFLCAESTTNPSNSPYVPTHKGAFNKAVEMLQQGHRKKVILVHAAKMLPVSTILLNDDGQVVEIRK